MLRSLLSRLRRDRPPSASSEDETASSTDGTDGAGASHDETGETDEPADDAGGDAAAGPADGEESSSSVWDFIPDWQYDGRHVESGGLQRDEQEEALRDIQRQAAEIEASEDRSSGSSNE